MCLTADATTNLTNVRKLPQNCIHPFNSVELSLLRAKFHSSDGQQQA